MPEYAGLIKYPTGGDIYGGGKEPQWWKDLAVTTLAQINASGTYRTHISGTFNADDAADGTDLVHLAVSQTGTPEQGTWWITTATIAGTSRMQEAVSYGAGPRVMRRFRGSGGWSGWERTDAGAIDLSSLGGGGSGTSPASFKTVPLALTVGGGYVTGPTPSNGIRMPVRFGVTIKRWRLHLRNINPRFGDDGDELRLGHVYFGRATNGQFSAPAPKIIEGYVYIAPGGVASPWQDTPIEAGSEYAIAYTVAGGTAQGSIGGGWSVTGSVGGVDATLARVSTLPLDAWIEAEVEPEVPVVAAFGDSISSGVGATLPVLDSWLSQWCRANAALPVHYTASGDSMAGWDDSTAFKWQRWQHLSRPDAVIHAMGSNDVFGGATLATLKERRAKSLDQLASLVSPVIYSATITPRNAVTGAMEDTRRAYNAHVMGKPDAARGAFNFAAAVSGDDETISPGFNADGTHLNTAGYAQLGTSITAPLTSHALSELAQEIETHTHARIENALGSVRLDSVGQLQHLVGGVVRTQFNTSGEMVAGTVPTSRIPGLDAALYKSGPRRLTTLENGWTGDVRIARVGQWVTLILNGINGAAATSDIAFTLPPGMTPATLLGTFRADLHIANGSGATTVYRAYVASNGFRVTGGVGYTRSLYGSPITFLTDDPIPTTPPWSAA